MKLHEIGNTRDFSKKRSVGTWASKRGSQPRGKGLFSSGGEGHDLISEDRVRGQDKSSEMER